MDKISPDVHQAALKLGEALKASRTVLAFLDAQRELDADPEAAALKARLAEVYDSIIARQSAGQVIPSGEIDEYYALENQVHSRPSLSNQEARLDELKDLMSETNELLSNALGINLLDLIQD